MSTTTNATAADLLAPSHDMMRMVAMNGTRLVLAEIPLGQIDANWTSIGTACATLAKVFQAVATAVCGEEAR